MEAASAITSTSKVIVQCTDPSNLFDDVAPLLQTRLPLSNLHWKSATRPLRPINNLEVSLVREQAEAAKSIARHQIPGLRQTPFVKVYLVRCDEKEQYKEAVRKEVKDWVKSLGVSTSGKSTIKGQERHDAFEYLIVHVVLPGTPAAIQPKSSKHISPEATESTDSVNSTSKSKWTGKSSSTIYDKLRADFHSSSKAPFERVAQVRITDPAKPSTALSPLEIEEQWQSLIEKLKTAILQSFDARVAQYEEDIREREAQRSLPGWNFCTFFILKEGLARGFENVGLLEDALQIYEELDAGLDSVIQEQAREDYVDAANALLPYASDLKDTIRKVLEDGNARGGQDSDKVGLSLQAWTTVEAKRFPWRLERRNYQQMILTNQVSALDFRIYIFIRQMQIMLRRANVPSPVPKLKGAQRPSEPRWDANILSDICVRSVKFLNLAARNLRQDLFTAWGGQEGLPVDEREIQRIAIDNIVASWKWSSLLQTLLECQVVSSLSRLVAESNGDNQGSGMFSPTDIAESQVRRDRGYSVSTTASSEGSTEANGAKPSIGKDIFSALRVVQGSKDAFIFQAAELFLMLRTILVQLCRENGMLEFLRLKTASSSAAQANDTTSGLTGVLAPSLLSLLGSETSAVNAYKLLTVCACQCYTTAGKLRASRQLLYDLAQLEVQSESYDAAMAWLDVIPGSMETPPRTPMDHSILQLYIICLRKTGRHEDLIQNIFISLRSLPYTTRNELTIQQTWTELREIAGNCGGVNLAFDSMFAVRKLDSFITHDAQFNKFTVSLTLQTLVVTKDIGHGTISLELHSRSQKMPQMIMLQYEGNLSVENGLLNAALETCSTTEGWYEAVSLEVAVDNVRFKHDFASSAQAINTEDQQFNIIPSPRFQLYIYPHVNSPQLHASDSHVRDFSQRRSLSIRISWDKNQDSIHSAQLRLKPATAGFRLDLLSTISPGGHHFEITRVEDTHCIEIFSVQQSGTVLEIPYVLDNPATLSVSTRAELRYITETGTFKLYDTLSTTCILPISVNVQDIFQADAVFSQFTFAPSRPIPLEITDCQLTGNEKYHVVTAGPKPTCTQAFAKQPASWVARIVGRSQSNEAVVPQDKDKSQLGLSVIYRCIDEAILQTIQDKFSGSIEDTTYNYASRPLLSHLASKLQSLWTENEIELVALTSEIEMWSFEELDWATLLHAFAKKARSDLTNWLQRWHEQHQVIQLRLETAPVRTLKLFVDAPRAQIVVTTRVILDTSSRKFHAAYYTVGQPLLARLQISMKQSSEIVTNHELSVEVTGQNDLWLVGGHRKAVFSLRNESFESTIILVAQKAGFLLLPLVDVKCRNTDNGQQVAVEVEHQSSATAIEVREGVASTTIGIGDGELAEGHWVVDSRKVDSTSADSM
ncbi:hypothetical protein H2198_002849 [Neophaeococcomyces mojaviensis]|uniref:Uncharacterized protein n=1 Tax=Neophaeococcomyces mojaviensis TaxID=3383035 RepID=A0ACC3ADI7_9EURO|nr:hypothetical protein H2198_002849 [Knufia sp. JES_112]